MYFVLAIVRILLEMFEINILKYKKLSFFIKYNSI